MAYEKQIQHLEKAYGPIAKKLDDLTEFVWQAYEDEKPTKALIKNLVDYCQKPEVKNVVELLSKDKYVYSRALAGYIIEDLWTHWKNLPYDSKKQREYSQSIKDYTKTLGWTLPILHQLLADKRSWPATQALYATRDISEEVLDKNERKKLQDLLIKLYGRSETNIRLEVVRWLDNLYPFGLDGRVLDKSAVNLFITATHDTSEDVRNWSYFALNRVDKIDIDIESALSDALAKEDPTSEAYGEVLVGLARCARADVDEILCKQFRTGDCGMLWIDAAQNSHSTECLEALVDLYVHVRKEDNINDWWMDRLEGVIENWNEDV